MIDSVTAKLARAREHMVEVDVALLTTSRSYTVSAGVKHQCPPQAHIHTSRRRS
jgi:hypothetical protein